MLEKESVVNIDIDWKTLTMTKVTLSSTTTTPDIYPFYLDSGATIHISPNATDFVSLTPIPNKSIQGVGGSAIFVTAIGKMDLRLADGSHLMLDDALLVSKATVRLLSVSSIAKKNGIFTIFSNTSTTLFKETLYSCNTIVANNKYSHPYMASLATVHALEVIQIFPQPGQNPLWMMTKVDAPWEMSNITQS